MSERIASSGASEGRGSARPSADPIATTSDPSGTVTDPLVSPSNSEAAGLDSGGNALEAWINEYSADLFRYAFRLTGEQANAEDLVQQVFLQAWRHRGRLGAIENAKSWLLKITRNQFLKSVRRRRPEAFSNLGLDDQALADQAPVHDSGDVTALLEGLGEEQRLIVLMFYVERLSYRDIAEELGVPTGTVMSRLHRAKSRLKVLWERRDESPPQERPSD